jgi:3-hydroxyacyl-[acyl-carrier-protein] dehydratase
MNQALSENIIKKLPYSEPFLFVDEICEVNSKCITGKYSFRKDSFFYNSHFVNNPVTPGTLILEMMGQIGLVCHLIFIEELYLSNNSFYPLVTNLEASFVKKVIAGEALSVIGKKIYYRHGILKSDLSLYNSNMVLCAHVTAQLLFSHE